MTQENRAINRAPLFGLKGIIGEPGAGLANCRAAFGNQGFGVWGLSELRLKRLCFSLKGIWGNFGVLRARA